MIARLGGHFVPGRERAKAHQHLAVARYHCNPPARLGQRKAKADHGSAAHGAPKVKVLIIVARGRRVPGGRSKTWNNQQVITPAGKQRRHGGTTFDRHLVHTFLPINCCDRITAAIRSSPKTCWMARWVTPTTSSGSLAR